MTPPKSALVIGAGVVGVSTAYALARRGIKVRLVDRRDGPAMEASHANGAQLSYLYTDALANPALLAQLPRLALGLVPAFRLRMRVDPDYIRWLLAFVHNCTSTRFRNNTLATLELALESRRAMDDFLAKHPIDFDYRTAGKLHVYRDRKGWDAARRVAEMKAGPGVVQNALSIAEAALLEPALKEASPGIEGAIYSPEEAVGDPHHFAREMRDLLVNSYQVTTSFDFRVKRIDLQRDRAFAFDAAGAELTADIIVDCSGAQGGRLMSEHGVSVPIIAMKGHSFTAPSTSASPSISITDVGARVVFTNLGGRIRVAGLADLGQTDPAVDPDRMKTLIASARGSMPGAADFDRSAAHWAGLRPMTPDAQPRIARPHPRLAYNLGHGMLGWTLAMGSAERLAHLVER